MDDVNDRGEMLVYNITSSIPTLSSLRSFSTGTTGFLSNEYFVRHSGQQFDHVNIVPGVGIMFTLSVSGVKLNTK